MSSDHEILEGYVVDIACLRKWPQQAIIEKARAHARRCALEGHCLESGFGLVDDTGRIALLEAAATPKVAEAIKWSLRETGIRLRVVRENEDGELRTVSVEEVTGQGDWIPVTAES